jgi:hypothetical protein
MNSHPSLLSASRGWWADFGPTAAQGPLALMRLRGPCQAKRKVPHHVTRASFHLSPGLQKCRPSFQLFLGWGMVISGRRLRQSIIRLRRLLCTTPFVAVLVPRRYRTLLNLSTFFFSTSKMHQSPKATSAILATEREEGREGGREGGRERRREARNPAHRPRLTLLAVFGGLY